MSDGELRRVEVIDDGQCYWVTTTPYLPRDGVSKCIVFAKLAKEVVEFERLRCTRCDWTEIVPAEERTAVMRHIGCGGAIAEEDVE
jgi:hypothetical protein